MLIGGSEGGKKGGNAMHPVPPFFRLCVFRKEEASEERRRIVLSLCCVQQKEEEKEGGWGWVGWVGGGGGGGERRVERDRKGRLLIAVYLSHRIFLFLPFPSPPFFSFCTTNKGPITAFSIGDYEGTGIVIGKKDDTICQPTRQSKSE